MLHRWPLFQLDWIHHRVEGRESSQSRRTRIAPAVRGGPRSIRLTIYKWTRIVPLSKSHPQQPPPTHSTKDHLNHPLFSRKHATCPYQMRCTLILSLALSLLVINAPGLTMGHCLKLRSSSPSVQELKSTTLMRRNLCKWLHKGDKKEDDPEESYAKKPEDPSSYGKGGGDEYPGNGDGGDDEWPEKEDGEDDPWGHEDGSSAGENGSKASDGSQKASDPEFKKSGGSDGGSYPSDSSSYSNH
ncbi:hypothetical protein MJO28_005709 [Puccinia striiformis f. sp. tritici]|nr:hypothetical protein Pst134EA_009816 [Puccinia striiformis f. sp. tritici]KAI9612116.1 hypothetical protein H4Q26_008208 [Puccinia striiformis f. sp. tritici PST-130]KAH9458633.1 hypothetical protein Pst134EB_010931 [Puccinia striiformis f. sp. tritici]KAH9469294.1 hypothetical protein Pst134EA_009816 [Puccinia striiformis f. sp. tritici]KAI7955309.1 hypothetical protein MJO28_005709 [Puccinia striiformis f. sp. tritici]KAI9620706.1 hypothetical protein KEM48_008056 [Puccinia striiformis f.